MLLSGSKIMWILSFIIFISCSDHESTDDPNFNDPNAITILNGDFPKPLNLPPGGDNGAYDATVATDPETGRVWMVFSRVVGPAGSGRVSTHLAYSDNGGSTWEYSGIINQAQEVSLDNLPIEFSNAVEAYWQHEVPSIAYDSAAPADQRWRLIWHRYLHVDDGIAGNEDRKIANYGWIATKTATSPTSLAIVAEEKLFSGLGYHFTQDIEDYNNSIVGVPQVKFHELSSSVSGSVALTEPGMTSFNGNLYVSMLSRTATDGYIELVKLNHSTQEWVHIATILDPDDAAMLNPQWQNFSATDLFLKESQAYLLVSPVITLYEGSLLLKINLENGSLVLDENGKPEIFWSQIKTENLIQSGVPTYDPGLTSTGILIGDVTFDEPQFKMYATGIAP